MINNIILTPLPLHALKSDGSLWGGSSVLLIYSGIHLSSERLRGAGVLSRSALILSVFRDLFLMFSFSTTSLTASKQHLGI
jgi:hypothetical protein